MSARRYIKQAAKAGAVLFMLAIAVGVFLFARSMMESAPQKKTVVQQISLIQPPPPPPPLEQPPPPPPEVEEKVEVPEPEKMPEEAPEQAADEPLLGDDLAVDAEGGAGGDAFGLLGKLGGRDLLISGRRGDAYAWYTAAVKNEIQDVLSESNEIRKRRYSVDLKLWIESNGKVKRAELVNSSGHSDIDHSLKKMLARLDHIREKPPTDMPQPIRLRVYSRI